MKYFSHRIKNLVLLIIISAAHSLSAAYTIPLVSKVESGSNAFINAKPGRYTLSLNVWIDVNLSVKSFYTAIKSPYVLSEWDLSDIEPGKWVKLEKEINIKKEAVNTPFQLFVSNHPDENKGSGIFYVDDINLVLVELYSNISKELESFEFTVYPNPSDSEITVVAPTGAKIEVYSITGMLVLSDLVSDMEQQIQIGSLEQGTYVVKVLNNNTFSFQKLIVLAR